MTRSHFCAVSWQGFRQINELTLVQKNSYAERTEKAQSTQREAELSLCVLCVNSVLEVTQLPRERWHPAGSRQRWR